MNFGLILDECVSISANIYIDLDEICMNINEDLIQDD